ncbi:unnamed protein product [Dicrocoelium dendriticum]|nr:unnamed protein product [Dicrocoelium dendriticum]
MLIDLVRSGKSYDSLPNFTAVDCLRLLGFGRNQYIETMNTYKSFLTTAGPDHANDLYEILYDILPHQPIETVIFEPWHVVHIGAVLLQDVEQSTESERHLIDQIIDAERCNPSGDKSGLQVREVDASVLRQLFNRGLVYIDVPVSEEDRICVSTLESFVMNRTKGDDRENLLYKIFVSTDENTTIKELAECLQVEVSLVAQAASVFCRLGFACKRSFFDPRSANSSTDLVDSLLGESGETAHHYTINLHHSPSSTGHKMNKKLAFIFDSTVTAYLMMGNLSARLKPHAVTMFEVGKLSDESLEAFLSELDNLSSIDEGEAKLYYEHAINLRKAIHFLQSQARLDSTDFHAIDLLRGGSLLNLESSARSRILQKNYNLIISLSPITYEDKQASSTSWPCHIGPPVPEANSPWFRLYTSCVAGNISLCADEPEAQNGVLPLLLLVRGARLSYLPQCFLACSRFLVTTWGHDPVSMPANSLLNSVNDMLPSSPVLVQASNLYIDGPQLYHRHIPFPLHSDLLSCEQFRVSLPFLIRLHKHLSLTSLCGYITVLAPCLSELNHETPRQSTEDSISDDTAQVNSPLTPNHLDCEFPLNPSDMVLHPEEIFELVRQNQPFYFISLHLGLPIFSFSLLQAVCHQVISDHVNLLLPAHRSKLDAANKCLASNLYQFMSDLCDTEGFLPNACPPAVNDRPSCCWPFPSRNVLCFNGQLTSLP